MRADFRSDTVTKPTPAMRAAMQVAELGDDVFRDDPSVNSLEAYAAERLGFEAALFAASGTQTNLIALMAHCQRGDEYLVGQEAHTYRYEGGGAAVLGSIQPQPLLNQADGTIALADVKAAIKPIDDHFARTRLLALENTIGGRVLPVDYVGDATALAREHGLACHLDGARIFNAAVKLGVDARELVAPFDSVSVCLSKGLGAPVGSVLLGSRALITSARRWRKMLGGGMRQAGLLAAAGEHALRHHVDRLAVDHLHAMLLAQGLAEIAPERLRVSMPQTNIVFVDVPEDGVALAAHLAAADVLVTGVTRQRWVTHLDVGADDVARAVEVVQAFFART